jgi:hypothetical protein
LQRVEGCRIPEQSSHALFQLTGALRNVAGEEEIFPQFVSTGAVNELCRSMELFSSDLDVISNISRTLRYRGSFKCCHYLECSKHVSEAGSDSVVRKKVKILKLLCWSIPLILSLFLFPGDS